MKNALLGCLLFLGGVASAADYTGPIFDAHLHLLEPWKMCAEYSDLHFAMPNV